MKYKKLLLIGLFLGLSGTSTHADILGQNVSFFTNPKYDYAGRSQITATLYASSTHAYYYVEDSYWVSLSTTEKSNFTASLNQIAQDFDNNIYPEETALWGSVGLLRGTNDPKVTTLLAHLTQGTGGYFDSTNEYPPADSPTSNYRKMLVVNAVSLGSNSKVINSLISHEFQHLVAFNQKDHLRSVSEDNWLNELRSEYSINLNGYNDPFYGSTLERRLNEYLTNPSDSLTEWLNQSFEYGAISLFAEYLTDQYGPGILKESLQSPKIGIASINDYMTRHGSIQSFKDIFKNWAITNYLNSPGDPVYSYHRQDLKNFHVLPKETNLFSPFSYALNYSLKPWQPAWYKFNLDPAIPKTKVLKLEFQSSADFAVVYLDSTGHRELASPTYLTPSTGSGQASLPTNFVLIPINKSQITGFTANDPAATLNLNISFVDSVPAGATITSTAPTTSSSQIPDGALIRKVGGTDLYVITGKYKRYMSPRAIALYGHLDPAKAIEVTADVFDSYPTSNYIRIVGTNNIYAVWPDGTKHLIKVSFSASGRDPKLIFTINPLEYNIYKLGIPILR